MKNIIYIRNPDARNFLMVGAPRNAGTRYESSDGQHYIVTHHGSLRRCDARGNLTPRVRKHRVRQRRMGR